MLNDAYRPARVRFTLVSTEVVANDAWYNLAVGSKEEKAMKGALRRGGGDALNIYTAELAGGLLGWATFPKSYHAQPADDGVVVFNESLLGGHLSFPSANEPDGTITYDLGDTGTHEVGHWLGLYHTFQGGCSASGDKLDDTPAEAGPQFYCVERDSCPGRPGIDPIHNFMDYVDDACMVEFTTDQDARMRDQWVTYRD